MVLRNLSLIDPETKFLVLSSNTLLACLLLTGVKAMPQVGHLIPLVIEFMIRVRVSWTKLRNGISFLGCSESRFRIQELRFLLFWCNASYCSSTPWKEVGRVPLFSDFAYFVSVTVLGKKLTWLVFKIPWWICL